MKYKKNIPLILLALALYVASAFYVAELIGRSIDQTLDQRRSEVERIISQRQGGDSRTQEDEMKDQIDLIAIAPGDSSVGIQDDIWTVDNVGPFEDGDHREGVRALFKDAFLCIADGRVRVLFSDELPGDDRGPPTALPAAKSARS